jgi:hypothetical protein
MKKICFFSSDARPLYTLDVFRAMSYPKGFVIHFRYQPQYVNLDLNGIKKGQAGVIFFSIGNDLSVPIASRAPINISIRDVTIHSFEEKDDTGLVHFYLQLGDFKKVTLSDKHTALEPPYIFVSELEVVDGPTAKWFEVIDLIKAKFPNQLFYKFQLMEKDGKELSPLFNDSEKQSYYDLSDESNYSMEMAFYDSEPSNSNNYHSLMITAKNENLVKVVAPKTIDLHARRDNRKYSIFTQTVSSSEASTYINFEAILKGNGQDSTQKDEDQVSSADTTLKIEVTKNSGRIRWFAFYSVIAAGSLGYSKLLLDKVDLKGSFDFNLAWQFIIPIVLGFLSAYNLYRVFDKK